MARTEENHGKIIVHIDPMIKDIVPAFLDIRADDIKAISMALSREDYDAIRVIGHSMKGTGGGYGFDTITDIGNSLERAAKEQDRGRVEALADELVSYLQQLEIVYE